MAGRVKLVLGTMEFGRGPDQDTVSWCRTRTASTNKTATCFVGYGLLQPRTPPPNPHADQQDGAVFPSQRQQRTGHCVHVHCREIRNHSRRYATVPRHESWHPDCHQGFHDPLLCSICLLSPPHSFPGRLCSVNNFAGSGICRLNLFLSTGNWTIHGGPNAIKANPWGNNSLRPAGLKTQLTTSLGRLKAEQVDLFYLHAPDHSTPIQETLACVQQLYTEGKFKRLGLSNYAAWQVVGK